MTIDNDQVWVRLIRRAQQDVPVSAAAFRAARASATETGELDALFEPHVGALESEAVTAVVSPDGVLTELFTVRATSRRTLLGSNPTEALASLIGSIRPRPYCGHCDQVHQVACARHIAEELVAGVRLEDLIIMPAVEADAAIAAFVPPLSPGPGPARVFVSHATDPAITVEVTGGDGSGSWDAVCLHPKCSFAAGQSEDRHVDLAGIVQEAAVHVDHHAH